MKLGNRVRSSGIWCGSIRKICASHFRVQTHMAAPSTHSFRRCCRVSVLLHLLQMSVSTILIAARRVFVGRMSWITTYRTDLISSDTLSCLDCAILVAS